MGSDNVFVLTGGMGKVQMLHAFVPDACLIIQNTSNIQVDKSHLDLDLPNKILDLAHSSLEICAGLLFRWTAESGFRYCGHGQACVFVVTGGMGKVQMLDAFVPHILSKTQATWDGQSADAPCFCASCQPYYPKHKRHTGG